MYTYVVVFFVKIACFDLNGFYIRKLIYKCMHAYACACMYTCVCIHEWVFISMYMSVHAYMCMCMHMCVYVHFTIPSPILNWPRWLCTPNPPPPPPLYYKASYAYVTCISSRETPFLNIGKSHLQPAHNRPIFVKLFLHLLPKQWSVSLLLNFI